MLLCAVDGKAYEIEAQTCLARLAAADAGGARDCDRASHDYPALQAADGAWHRSLLLAQTLVAMDNDPDVVGWSFSDGETLARFALVEKSDPRHCAGSANGDHLVCPPKPFRVD